jgi:hypothetical protein
MARAKMPRVVRVILFPPLVVAATVLIGRAVRDRDVLLIQQATCRRKTGADPGDSARLTDHRGQDLHGPL